MDFFLGRYITSSEYAGIGFVRQKPHSEVGTLSSVGRAVEFGKNNVILSMFARTALGQSRFCELLLRARIPEI